MLKKALSESDNNYYVCHNCGKKIAQNEIQRRSGCKYCKNYSLDEIKAGMKILEKDESDNNERELTEYLIANNLTLKQMWDNKDPIMMKWLNSKQVDSFSDFQNYVEEVKQKNLFDKYSQDWINKIPGTERFDSLTDYQNHREKLRKNPPPNPYDGFNFFTNFDPILLLGIYILSWVIGFFIWPSLVIDRIIPEPSTFSVNYYLTKGLLFL